MSPILLNLESNSANDRLTSAEDGVVFDHAGRGRFVQSAWTRAGLRVGFLGLDRNGNGAFDSGQELFGSSSIKRDGSLALNGFEALSEFDMNADARIDRHDVVFAELRLWIDLNHDGVTSAGELLSMTEAGIRAIGTDYRERKRRDRHGNWYRYEGEAVMSGGEERRIFDVYLVTQAAATTR